ncbi:hypothetical protein, partial [Escherichia coli]|uniref:hypothetical protein n=1 Tax=Escherichia coli TaxID=562 RepID=UPI00215B58DF
MLNHAYNDGIIIKATIKNVATGFLKILFQSKINSSHVFYAKVIQAQKKAGDFMKHIKNTWELFILDWKR